MATLTFYVSRRGADKIECKAEIPHSKDYAAFSGGRIKVQTPKGEREVYVSGFKKLVLDSMAIELQNGVRDFLLPKDEEKTTSGKRSRIVEE